MKEEPRVNTKEESKSSIIYIYYVNNVVAGRKQ
jgi:hypothetical protein